ncbi:MAG TPA: hypothetical protein VH373_23290 [Jatrophihabitantaceae bacterium]
MTSTTDTPETIRPPRTIQAAFATTIAHVVLSIGNSAMLWGFQDYLRKQLIKSNNKAKAKDKKDYSDTAQGLHNLHHDLQNGLKVGLIQIIVFSFLVVLLAVNFRKGRGWARWAEILVLVIVVQAPFRLLNLGGDAPIVMRLVSALVGLTGLAVIVLLVLPQSSAYFAAVKGVTAGDRAGGAASMGFRNLFGPRRPPADDATSPAGRDAPRANARVGRPPATPAADKKPANVRPGKPRSDPNAGAGAAASVPTAKAKARTSGEPPADSSASGSQPARPSTSVASKNRGKSRRGS